MIGYHDPGNDLRGEPSLDELFAEPIVRLIMRRDGVEESTMRGAIDRVQKSYLPAGQA